MDPLDNPVWQALTSRHAHLAAGAGRARRYRDRVSVFWAVDRPEPDAWRELRALALDGGRRDGDDGGGAGDGDDGWGGQVVLIGPTSDPRPDWPVRWQLDGFQMVLDRLVEVPVPSDVRRLGPDDVDAMLELVEQTRPGPFLPGTIEMGDYHGVVRDGRLLAMAGQRFHLGGGHDGHADGMGGGSGSGGGFHEVSAVATHPDVRGQGIAAGLSTLVAQGIVADGDLPFLHVVGTNTGAIRVYERLGFRVRTPYLFTAYQLP